MRGGSLNITERVYPCPLGAGSARPNPKMGASDPESPLFLGFSVLRGGSRPWSQKGARPWGRGRSGHCEIIGVVRTPFAMIDLRFWTGAPC